MAGKTIAGIRKEIWYKAFHVLFACAWFGAVLAVVLLYLLSKLQGEDYPLATNAALIEKIDHFIIIPSSLACFLTGLLISWKSNWGFVKYQWVLSKLVMGTALILFGIFFLGPWILQAPVVLERDYLSYMQLQDKLGISMIVQAFFILVVILISTLKPWGKTRWK